MSETKSTPAAQYLRMSTEGQEYSLANQAAAILVYAQAHSFSIVRTYEDAGRSGLLLKQRAGLRSLLNDVTSGSPSFRAILVYDVSRWGRFQDTDEAAHYEFLCKSAGVPVHYCAEMFSNDGSISSVILKALKRTMAAEYSRELSAKVYEGLKRLAYLGYHLGGRPVIGLRRMLITRDGTQKQILHAGDLKNVSTDRVILIPGPQAEIDLVRDIYRRFAAGPYSPRIIAKDLNRTGVPNPEGRPWDRSRIYSILRDYSYIGTSVWGRKSRKLHGPQITHPQSEWIIKPGAFEAIVPRELFEKVEAIRHRYPRFRSDEQILDAIRTVWRSEGKLTQAVIEDSLDVAAPTTLHHRFGSLTRVYELVGYRPRRSYTGRIVVRKRTQALRAVLLGELKRLFPNEVEIRKKKRLRATLRIRKGPNIAVTLWRAVQTPLGNPRWVFDPQPPRERRMITLCARLNAENSAFRDFLLMPPIRGRHTLRYREGDARLNAGIRMRRLADFRDAVSRLTGKIRVA